MAAMEEINERDPEPLPLPQSMEEVEQLVKQFYGLNSPRNYSRIDQCLKAVQKSVGSFELADSLMNSQDPNVRFFGALTFTVKINRDWGTLEPQAGNELLNRLLHWFVTCVANKEISIVVRKLCVALVAIFKQSEGSWTRCIKHIIVCCLSNSVVDYAAVSSYDDVACTPNSMSEQQIVATLDFGLALLEEISQLNLDSAQNNRVNIATYQNVPDIARLIDFGLRQDNPPLQTVLKESIKTLQTLYFYAEKTKVEPDYSHEILHLCELALRPLDTDELFSAVAGFLGDLTGTDMGRKLSKPIIQKLSSPYFQNVMGELLEGDFTNDNDTYGGLWISYAHAWIDDFAQGIIWSAGQENLLLDQLVALTQCKGYAAEDDILILDLLEFWSSFVEVAISSGPQSTDTGKEIPSWLVDSETYIRKVLEAFLKKLEMPPVEVYENWDREVQLMFRSLRRDFRDFSASAYTLLGPDMLTTVVNYALRLWQGGNWQGVEVSLQCIKGVAEIVVDDKVGDKALLGLFTSPLLSDLSNLEQSLPRSIRQTAIELITECGLFFKRHSASVEPIMDFLLRCVQSPTLALTSAKAVAAICDSCRTDLVDFSGLLASRYAQFIKASGRPIEVKEKLGTGIAAVVQAQWSKPAVGGRDFRIEATEAMDLLLEPLGQLFETCISEYSISGYDYGLSAMQCLVSLSKGFRSPDSDVIDLEDDEDRGAQSFSSTDVWRIERQKVFSGYIVQVLDRYPKDGEMMESVCNLLRTGMTEELDNPFRAPVDAFECLISRYFLETSRPGYLLDTIARFLRISAPAKEVSPEKTALLARYCLLAALQMLERVKDDPRENSDKVSSVIDFVTTYLPKYTGLICDNVIAPYLSTYLQTALRCLTLPEPILKQSSANFWTKLLETRLDSRAPAAADLAAMVDSCGPQLSQALIVGIGGNAARSDLDTLIQPLKKLIFRGGHSKAWLEAAICSNSFPSQRVSEMEKRTFVQTIMRLRGDSKTNSIVKDFWVKCRGTFS